MAIELNYLAATTFVKISILCFYRRMSGSIKTAFVYGVWAMIVFCVLYSIIFAILIICTCTPVIGFFHMFDILWRVHNELTCRDEGAIVVACAIIGTVQDLFICLLPVLLIWNLKMARRQKAALFGIFGIGLITCVCGILRTYYATYVYYGEFAFDVIRPNNANCNSDVRHYLVRILRLDLDSTRSRFWHDLRLCAGSQGVLQALLLSFLREWSIRFYQYANSIVTVTR
jgi:hypothetical protein